MESTYEKQAADFVAATGLRITFRYRGHQPFEGAKAPTALWLVTFAREGRKPWTFEYHDSLHDSYEWADDRDGRWGAMPATLYGKVEAGTRRTIADAEQAAAAAGEPVAWGGYWVRRAHPEPTAYDVLACLTKYDPGPHSVFCGDFGYDPDSIKGLNTWKAVAEEWHNVQRFFSEQELEQLRGIA